MTGLCYHAPNENNPFYMDRICAICSSYAYDVTIVAQVLSQYVCHLVTNQQISPISTHGEKEQCCLLGFRIYRIFPLLFEDVK